MAHAFLKKALPEVTDFEVHINDIENFSNKLLIQKINISYNKLIMFGEDLFFNVTIDSCVNKLDKNLIFF